TAAAVAASAAACASTQVAEEDRLPGEIADPLETLNRHIFAVNLTLDTFILRPAAVGYREIVPDVGKTAVRNFVNNLKSPITLIHDLAQGEWDRAQITYGRFLMNTTLGLGGLFDLAGDHFGLPYHEEDAGRTFAGRGAGEGFDLVLPGFGLSNLRVAAGRAVDWYSDPLGFAAEEADLEAANYVATGLNGVDARYRALGQLDAVRRRSLDFYAAVRS